MNYIDEERADGYADLVNAQQEMLRMVANSERIALWHECPLGNSFGVWLDEQKPCSACGKVETLPTVRYIYDEYTEPDSNLINADTFPMLVGRWEPGQVRGGNG